MNLITFSYYVCSILREDNARDRDDRLRESGLGAGNIGIGQGNMSAPNNTPDSAANQEGNTVENITANHRMENEDNMVTTASDVVTEFEPFTGPFVGGEPPLQFKF